MNPCENRQGAGEVKDGVGGGRPLRVVITCGEPSGEVIGRVVERCLLAAAPASSVTLLNLSGRAGPVFGFAEGLRAASRALGWTHHALRAVRDCEPDVVVQVGYPGLHLVLGRRLRAAGIPVVWVGPPQFWAWGRFRIGWLRRAADRVICMFDFEVAPLRRAGISAVYYGYPLFDAVQAFRSREKVLARLGLAPGVQYLAFMPGSRRSEQRFHVPLYCRVFEQVREADPELHGVVIAEESTIYELRCQFPNRLPEGMVATQEERYDVLCHAAGALVVSGTASAEAALLKVPHIVTYHLSPSTRLLARLLVRVRRFAIPNIVAGREVVPEYLEPSGQRLVSDCLRMIRDPAWREQVRTGLNLVRARLGPAGSGAAIAREILCGW